MITLIHIDGGRGAGKSFLAHHLATTAYPDALVFEEHRFGLGEFDRRIGERRFFGPGLPPEEIDRRLRGHRDFVAIVLGERMTPRLMRTMRQAAVSGLQIITMQIHAGDPAFRDRLPPQYRDSPERAARS